MDFITGFFYHIYPSFVWLIRLITVGSSPVFERLVYCR